MARILSFGGSPKAAPAQPRNDLTYEEFYAEYYGYIIRYLTHHISVYQDAEDLAAECFVYCYTHWDSYNPEKSSLKSWLFIVVLSRLKNYYRDHRSSANLDDLIDVLPDDDDLIGTSTDLMAAREQLARGLEQLPQNQRRAIIMKYFGQMSDEQIAIKLSTSAGNVRVLMHRGIVKLRVVLADIDWGE